MNLLHLEITPVLNGQRGTQFTVALDRSLWLDTFLDQWDIQYKTRLAHQEHTIERLLHQLDKATRPSWFRRFFLGKKV